MRILIGTPIHESKDYSMEKWLKNVSKVRAKYPADLLLVDNSPGLDYVKKVKGYCKKYGISNYQIEHLEIPQEKRSGKNDGEQSHERIARSREIIRHEFLAKDYDAYFFWENDVLIPTNALGKLVDLMQAGDFMVVDHNCWISNAPNQVNFDYGIVLFNRECLEKYSFLPEVGTDPKMLDYWYEAEWRFRKRLLKDGCNVTEVEGLIEPVYHLAK
ncbi:MAG: hypothetical protein HY377_01625 [Candidatus Blackburnbacteria bacterium]|nr:hypothetical protein [Candidatus Blackburnbacteria bacterium]